MTDDKFDQPPLDAAAFTDWLVEQLGRPLLLVALRRAGGATLVHTLMRHDLVDAYRMMVHPVVLGGGKRLFHDGSGVKKLKLVETKPFASGIVVLTYQPA